MRYLYFGSVRGDLQEGYFYDSRCQSPSPRAQNRGFCALLGFVTLVFGHFEHKIEVFVRFWGLEPSFSGISSTTSRFLCAFSLRDPRFRAVRAQNRGFCALFAFKTLVFGLSEHKIEVFVLVNLMCSKRLRDYVLTPIYEASTFAEKQLKMEELIPAQSASHYRKTIDDYKLRLKDNPDLKLSEFCKEVHTNYRRVLGWTRRHGISISALKSKASGGTAWGLSDTEPGNAFIQFVPSSRLTSASLLGISITFPDGVNLTLQESSVESVISLLTIYQSRHGGAKSCSD